MTGPKINKAKYNPGKNELQIVAKAPYNCSGDLIIAEYGIVLERAGQLDPQDDRSYGPTARNGHGRQRLLRLDYRGSKLGSLHSLPTESVTGLSGKIRWPCIASVRQAVDLSLSL